MTEQIAQENLQTSLVDLENQDKEALIRLAWIPVRNIVRLDPEFIEAYEKKWQIDLSLKLEKRQNVRSAEAEYQNALILMEDIRLHYLAGNHIARDGRGQGIAMPLEVLPLGKFTSRNPGVGTINVYALLDGNSRFNAVTMLNAKQPYDKELLAAGLGPITHVPCKRSSDRTILTDRKKSISLQLSKNQHSSLTPLDTALALAEAYKLYVEEAKTEGGDGKTAQRAMEREIPNLNQSRISYAVRIAELYEKNESVFAEVRNGRITISVINKLLDSYDLPAVETLLKQLLEYYPDTKVTESKVRDWFLGVKHGYVSLDEKSHQTIQEGSKRKAPTESQVDSSLETDPEETSEKESSTPQRGARRKAQEAKAKATSSQKGKGADIPPWFNEHSRPEFVGKIKSTVWNELPDATLYKILLLIDPGIVS